MHNNYYFLRQLSQALKPKLIGFEIAACFSQEKDELVIGFTNETDEFYIKAILTSQFTALSFPVTFNRARANSINLFREIIGLRVQAVVQQENERSFYLALTENYSLLFKLFGNRSNIILFSGDEPLNLFNKKFDKDLNLRLSGLGRNIDINREFFLQQQPAIKSIYPTFGDIPVRYLEDLGYSTAGPEKQWELLMQTVNLLENPAYYIIKLEEKIRLSLLPLGDIRNTYADPVIALQEFVQVYLAEHNFEQKYTQAQQQLQRKLAGANSFREQMEYKLLELEYDNSFAQTADLIMANLTNIPPGATQVEVYNFYNNQQKIIDLSKKESPQKFAERLYKKNKNRRIELKYLAEKVKNKKAEIYILETALAELATVTTNRELKAFLKQNNPAVAEQKTEIQSLFKTFETGGFKILVGKNAGNNDLLTQRYTHKDDLWLHAKDVSGSHVVIKNQAGKNIPEPVLEKAAQLAAWYSKRKNDSLCPVLYTPKKYVRKPKGAAPGAVFVEREKVIPVKPENPFSQYPE